MKICPKCGKRYEENQNFCKTCGMRLVEENQRPSGNPPVKKKSHIGLYIMIVIFAICIGAGAFAVVKISDNKKQEEAEQSQVSKNDKSTDKADSKDVEEKDSRETKKDAEEDVEPVEGTMTAEEKAKAEDRTLVQECVTEEEIAKIISRWTGIPIAKLTEGEREKTLHLEDELHKRVIGQDEAVTKITESIIRSSRHKGSK